MTNKWWDRENFSLKKEGLLKKALFLKTIRNYFEKEGFVEVDTPALQVCPGMEVHLKAFETKLVETFGQEEKTMFLHTSPELSMKKLLSAGMERIYTFAHVFRNEERSQKHHPEFTMIEWYRAKEDYISMMKDTENIILSMSKAGGVSCFKRRDEQGQIKECSLTEGFEYLTVKEAFLKYAGFDVFKTIEEGNPLEPSPKKIMKEAEKLGIFYSQTDRYEDVFFRIMLEKVEPKIGRERPTFIYEYPTCLGALARKKPTDERVVERFELFALGVELCNAFSELTDEKEQRERFYHDQRLKKELYGDFYPIDEDFMAALKQMPEAAGNALGVERVIMLLLGADKIEDVLWVPVA
ncbi:MAG: EF-P lysine aminoacylase GenX [Alphaproteobacteria bacterium]|nr:EF-P lysine aminoacylase GenX [Alphaproteobacteria bacterium]